MCIYVSLSLYIYIYIYNYIHDATQGSLACRMFTEETQLKPMLRLVFVDLSRPSFAALCYEV